MMTKKFLISDRLRSVFLLISLLFGVYSPHLFSQTSTRDLMTFPEDFPLFNDFPELRALLEDFQVYWDDAIKTNKIELSYDDKEDYVYTPGQGGKYQKYKATLFKIKDNKLPLLTKYSMQKSIRDELKKLAQKIKFYLQFLEIDPPQTLDLICRKILDGKVIDLYELDTIHSAYSILKTYHYFLDRTGENDQSKILIDSSGSLTIPIKDADVSLTYTRPAEHQNITVKITSNSLRYKSLSYTLYNKQSLVAIIEQSTSKDNYFTKYWRSPGIIRWPTSRTLSRHQINLLITSGIAPIGLLLGDHPFDIFDGQIAVGPTFREHDEGHYQDIVELAEIFFVKQNYITQDSVRQYSTFESYLTAVLRRLSTARKIYLESYKKLNIQANSDPHRSVAFIYQWFAMLHENPINSFLVNKQEEGIEQRTLASIVSQAQDDIGDPRSSGMLSAWEGDVVFNRSYLRNHRGGVFNPQDIQAITNYIKTFFPETLLRLHQAYTHDCNGDCNLCLVPKPDQ